MPCLANIGARSRPSRAHRQKSRGLRAKQINVGIIGTGWCGGIRAETCAANPLVKELHIIEIKPARLQEVAKLTQPASAGSDYQALLM